MAVLQRIVVAGKLAEWEGDCIVLGRQPHVPVVFALH